MLTLPINAVCELGRVIQSFWKRELGEDHDLPDQAGVLWTLYWWLIMTLFASSFYSCWASIMLWELHQWEGVLKLRSLFQEWIVEKASFIGQYLIPGEAIGGPSEGRETERPSSSHLQECAFVRTKTTSEDSSNELDILRMVNFSFLKL